MAIRNTNFREKRLNSSASGASDRTPLLKNQMKNIIFLICALLIPSCLYAQNPLPSPSSQRRPSQPEEFCDPNFVGGLMSFTGTAELTLDDLLFQIHNRFGVNFLTGPDVGGLPINIKTTNIPWNTLLKSQLFMLGVRSTCVGNNTVQLVKSNRLANWQRRELDTASQATEFIKLKYLQPTTGGNVNIAGGSARQGSNGGCQGGAGQTSGQGGCGTFEKLITEIEKILGVSKSGTLTTYRETRAGNETTAVSTTEDGESDRPPTGSLTVIPGRNILAIRGTKDQLAQIRQIIALSDRPPFQVVIKGLVYTANENRLRDVGVQTSILARTADSRTIGGFQGAPISGAGSLFDFSTLIGTVEFSVQASALQQNGIISIKSRPFAIVLDGDTTDLNVGRQIPVLIQAQNSLGGSPGELQILEAGNLLSVTPRVIDDDNGNPVAVNLELQLESNDADLSVISQGVPSVTRRSIQSRLILSQEKTVILGGFTVDSIDNATSGTPGLSQIPVVGWLFKRKVRSSQINRLYFAISVSVVPYGSAVEPVVVPGATTDIPSITPEMQKAAEKSDANSVNKP